MDTIANSKTGLCGHHIPGQDRQMIEAAVDRMVVPNDTGIPNPCAYGSLIVEIACDTQWFTTFTMRSSPGRIVSCQ